MGVDSQHEDPRLSVRLLPSGTRMGQKRDMTGIELRTGSKGHEKFRAYVADPERPGRKLTGPWGTYEQAMEWRREALAIKAKAKRRARELHGRAALGRLERSLLHRGNGA
jgi:hypothetical protein